MTKDSIDPKVAVDVADACNVPRQVERAEQCSIDEVTPIDQMAMNPELWRKIMSARRDSSI